MPTGAREAGTRPALFLDRDGTVNVERDYLVRIEDFSFIDGAPQAIARINRAGLLVVVVTNQSGIGRGYFSRREVDQLHHHLQTELKKDDAHLDAIYLCPHRPGKDGGEECGCRKPQPGLLQRAAVELNIDLAASYMVGDKSADLEAGRRAGCRPLLVRSGYGRETEQGLVEPLPVYDDLAAAVAAILNRTDPAALRRGLEP